MLTLILTSTTSSPVFTELSTQTGIKNYKTPSEFLGALTVLEIDKKVVYYVTSFETGNTQHTYLHPYTLNLLSQWLGQVSVEYRCNRFPVEQSGM